MRNRFRVMVIGLLIIFFSFAMVDSAGNTKRIIFDNSVGFFGLDNDEATGFTGLRDDLEAMGYSVSDSLRLKANYKAISPRLLKKAGILVLINPIRPLSYRERQGIKRYIRNGGRLLLICDDPAAVENANSIAREFGVIYLRRYIASMKLSFNGNLVELHSAMPMRYNGGVEPEISFRTNATARVWDSLWEIGDELPVEDYYLLIGVGYGKGRVAFFSDKDFMLNYYYGKNSSALVKAIVSWFEYKRPFILSPKKPKIRISVRKVGFDSPRTSYFRFFISNPTSLSERVSIIPSDILRHVIELNSYSFELLPFSREDVLVMANCPYNITYIYDYLNITAISQNLSTSHLLPVEVKCIATK